jgi:hypothetical protein
MIQNLLKNWKTSTAGILMITAGVNILVFTEINPQNITMAVTSFCGGIGLLFARDGDKSSEQVGVKTDVPPTV